MIHFARFELHVTGSSIFSTVQKFCLHHKRLLELHALPPPARSYALLWEGIWAVTIPLLSQCIDCEGLWIWHPAEELGYLTVAERREQVHRKETEPRTGKKAVDIVSNRRCPLCDGMRSLLCSSECLVDVRHRLSSFSPDTNSINPEQDCIGEGNVFLQDD